MESSPYYELVVKSRRWVIDKGYMCTDEGFEVLTLEKNYKKAAKLLLDRLRGA